MQSASVGLVGIGGYGRVHLEHLLDFHDRGLLVLRAVVALPCDWNPSVSDRLSAIGCKRFDSFDSLVEALPRLRLQLCIVPTPIHEHAFMTETLLRAGAHVLVEKPIAANPADVERIIDAARTAGRTVAVGFQYLHAPEIQALKQQLHQGAIGRLQRICFHAAWPRSHAYYSRNEWAGRIRLGERWVLDSPVSNAMAHFLMLLLFLADDPMELSDGNVSLSAELYRVQPIETFDTAAFELRRGQGCRLQFYGTHSTAEISRPTLVIEGTDGTAEWVQDSHARWQRNGLHWRNEAGPESRTRERMLQDVLANLRGEPAFICTPEIAAAHVRCVWALHKHIPVHPLPPALASSRTTPTGPQTVIPDLDSVLLRAAKDGSSLKEAGASWAVARSTVAIEE